MGFYFSIVAFVMCLALNFVFFFKKNIGSEETIIYGKLLFTSLIGLLLEIITGLLYKLGYSYTNFAYILLSKSTFVYYLYFIYLFYSYIRAISKIKDSKISSMYLIAMILSIYILPLNFIEKSNIIIPSGLSYTLTIIYGLIFTVLDIVILITYCGEIQFKKIIPLIALFLFGSIDFAIIYFYPSEFVFGFILNISLFLMYFTIENPNMKLVEYEKKEKEKALRVAESKVIFLNNVSHDLRTPLNAIIGLCENINNNNPSDEIKDDANDLINASNSLLEVINNILEASKEESKKLDETDYNLDLKN